MTEEIPVVVPPRFAIVEILIEGTSPLIIHRFDQKFSSPRYPINKEQK
jgi:hypothetical protein